MHFAERNFLNLQMVCTILKAKGYKIVGGPATLCYAYDFGGSGSITCIEFAHPEFVKETRQEIRFPGLAVASGDSDEADVQAAFHAWVADSIHPIIPAKQAIQAAVLRQVETIRELLPEADLPPDWINPIEALAEQLRSNILPAPSGQDDSPF